MFDRKSIHRAHASAGVDWSCELVRHAVVIVQPEGKFKAQLSAQRLVKLLNRLNKLNEVDSFHLTYLTDLTYLTGWPTWTAFVPPNFLHFEECFPLPASPSGVEL